MHQTKKLTHFVSSDISFLLQNSRGEGGGGGAQKRRRLDRVAALGGTVLEHQASERGGRPTGKVPAAHVAEVVLHSGQRGPVHPDPSRTRRHGAPPGCRPERECTGKIQQQGVIEGRKKKIRKLKKSGSNSVFWGVVVDSEYEATDDIICSAHLWGIGLPFSRGREKNEFEFSD
jgi:hypothetical protein